MPAPNLLVFGSATEPAKPMALRAGPLNMLFEPETAFLRRICFGPTEILRGIYGAVRDRNWGTVSPRIEHLLVETNDSGFELSFGVDCRQDPIHFYWRGIIVGRTDGTISVTFDGEACSSFLRNRIGLCVLHPLVGCVGKTCVVEHTNGTLEQGAFPRFVSPHQPFKSIQAITHKPLPGVRVTVGFEGESFEMEDQRNWTDASFKTYGTPLELPFPVRVEAGTRIRQVVTVRVQAPHLDPRAIGRVGEALAAPVMVIPDRPTVSLPKIGLGMASHGQALTVKEAGRLRQLHLDHLRVDLLLAKADWHSTLQRATCEARALGCTLQIALFLSGGVEASQLEELAVAVMSQGASVSLWLVFHANEPATREHWVRLAKVILGRIGPGIPIAAGTNANFAELNRNRLPTDSLALPCFSVNPQVHAFDHTTVMENLEAQAQVVESVGQFSSPAVVISPITLRPRFNAVATAEEQTPAGELPPVVDPRQMSLFAAAWTLGSLAAFSGTGRVQGLTYYETTGWRGIMETEVGAPLPEKFPSLRGAVFPVFHLLVSLTGFRDAAPIAVGPAQHYAALALFKGNQRRVLVANLSGQEQALKVKLPAAAGGRLRMLDETNVEYAMREPDAFLAEGSGVINAVSGALELVLKAHGFLCLDLEMD